jgi:uridine kinase
MMRSELIQLLAEMILKVKVDHPLRVAIDGVDASGKTTLADELSQVMLEANRQIIRASVDNFHNPQHIRRRRGELSPEGFYYDSYNYDALEEVLLKPLGPNGDRRYRTAVFDLHQDQPLDVPAKKAAQDAVLLIDGIFLLRPRLMPFWDLALYLDADYTHTVARGVRRDAEFYGSPGEAAQRYQERYVPGQKLYHQQANPLDKADILIDNNDLEAPDFIRVPAHLWPDP